MIQQRTKDETRRDVEERWRQGNKEGRRGLMVTIPIAALLMAFVIFANQIGRYLRHIVDLWFG